MSRVVISRVLIATAVALMLSTTPKLAVAEPEGAAAGAVTGAVAGAIVGGPVGAAIGAVVGGVTGEVASNASSASNEAAVAPVAPAPAGPRGPVRPYTFEPETTGSVLETTCVRDASGVARCRREVVR